MPLLRKFDRTTLSRGSKSRNKVSVGEPAEGSLLSYEYIYLKKSTYEGRVLNLEDDLVFRYRTTDTVGADA